MRDRVAERMVELVKMDPGRLDSKKHPPIEAIERLLTEAKKDVPVYTRDEWFYRIVVIGLIVLIGLTILATILLGGTVPQYLSSLGSAALGGLVGLLVPAPSSKLRLGPKP